MRITLAISAAAIAAFSVMTGPVQARRADAPKATESATTASCSAYQQAADGSWTQLPCKETGEDRGQTQHKPAAQGSEPDAR
jgi:hypothetical protein